MSAQDNKALVRRFVDEVQSAGNIDLIDEICSPKFVNHSAPLRLPTDCEGIKIATVMFRRAFPDSYFTVEDMMAEGDKVATRKTFHGTHEEDEFMGTPPSGRGVSMGLIDIVRITEGRVVEHWSAGDTLGMMQELVSSLSRDSRRKPALPYALIQPDSSRTSLILLNMYRCTQAHNHPS